MRKNKSLILILMACMAVNAGCSRGTNNAGETAPGTTAAQVESSAEQTETSGDVRTLRIADVNAQDHVIVKALYHYSEKVNELSNGKIKIDVYPSGQLGEDSDCYELLQMGGLDLYRGNASTIGDYGKVKISAMALPYIFRDRDHFWKVCESETGKEVLDDLKESGIGMVGICYLDEGARNFFTTTKEITSLADIKGLKIRVQNSELMLSTISALGANPTPIDYNELYTALQTGVVDGAENPPASYYSNLFYEPAPYYVLDGHTYSPSMILMSEIVWNQLSEEEQNILMEAGEDTQQYNREMIEEADEEAYDALRKEGVTITELTDKEAWSEAMAPVYEKYGSDYLDLIDEISAVK